MHTIHIRPGKLSDLARLELIERETAAMFPPSDLPPEFAQPLPEAVLIEAMAGSLLWVAECESAGVAGFVVCSRQASCVHIVEMDVRPSHGRRGIGARLLMQACRVANRHGSRIATLTTFSHFPWNAPFYAKHGFVEIADVDQFPHLKEALRHERACGLANRVAMVRRAASVLSEPRGDEARVHSSSRKLQALE
ncbi:MAG: GNAT family N-acetyltransferase [Caldimonas sp.]